MNDYEWSSALAIGATLGAVVGAVFGWWALLVPGLLAGEAFVLMVRAAVRERRGA